MIMKDESSVIERCLTSVRPLISSFSIDDTGSTDNAIELSYSALEGINGKIHSENWVNFAYNRSKAIEHAKEDGEADYLLLGIDADEELILPKDYKLPELTHDCYRVEMRYGGITYKRPFIVNAKLPWRYECVTHEYLHLDTPFSVANLEGPYIHVRCEGARSRDPLKYQKDAATILKAMEDEPNGPHTLRYQYYLAQSYKDGGDNLNALKWFKIRASNGGWVEERYMASLWAARMMESLGMDTDEVIMAYLRAWEILPTRVEALGNLARYSRFKERFALGALFARTAALIPEPEESLFKESSWYQWTALDELAVNTYHMGDPRTCYASCLELLNRPGLPEDQKKRVKDNLKFAHDRIVERRRK